MSITSILANISCSDLERSAQWYAVVFERQPDQSPMEGLREWYVGKAGFQLYEGPDNAGRCTVTILVDDVHQQQQRLREAGFEPGNIQQANYTTVFQLWDPDKNLVVLAQPGKA